MKKPDAILVGDIHYRDDQPACRLDNFWETQKRKALWLYNLWEECGKCPVIQPGDVFHRWKSSPQVISAVLEYLPPMISIIGNHDAPAHNVEQFWRSSLKTVQLAQADFTYPRWPDFMMLCFNWGEEIHPSPPNSKRCVMVTHSMILSEKALFEGEYAGSFLRRMTGYDLIVTGHNHKPIVEKFRGRLLVNPGSFTRQTADETHEPRVYLWYDKDNSIKEVKVPIEEGVITREHLDIEKGRDTRISAFVESLVEHSVDTIKFTMNVVDRLEANKGKIRDSVRERILEAIDES